jgi:hypothetical protein
VSSCGKHQYFSELVLLTTFSKTRVENTSIFLGGLPRKLQTRRIWRSEGVGNARGPKAAAAERDGLVEELRAGLDEGLLVIMPPHSSFVRGIPIGATNFSDE